MEPTEPDTLMSVLVMSKVRNLINAFLLISAQRINQDEFWKRLILHKVL